MIRDDTPEWTEHFKPSPHEAVLAAAPGYRIDVDPDTQPAIYTRSYPAWIWRKLLPHLTDGSFKAQLVSELHAHGPNGQISVRIDHILTDPDRKDG